MALEKWRPMGVSIRRSPFEALERQMEDTVDRVFRGWPVRGLGRESVGWAPPLDMVDRKSELLVRVDVPGLDRNDIHLSVRNGVLTLQGSRQQAKEDMDNEFYAMERWAGSFSRSIALPQGVDHDRIEASFKNGVLEIHIPKTQEAKGRNIDITVA